MGIFVPISLVFAGVLVRLINLLKKAISYHLLTTHALQAGSRFCRLNPMMLRWEVVIKAAIIVGSVLVLDAAVRSGVLFYSFSRWTYTFLDLAFFVTTIGYGLVCYAALVWRVRLWLRYRPMPSVSDSELPGVTVIIPAFNEGALVRKSIVAAGNSRYPNAKLQLIIVDDGSTDDTWMHIVAAVDSLGPTANVLMIKQPQNMGKRQALYTGFRHASGEAIVTIDSDSILDQDALRNAVSALVREPRIGAVAGCVEVLNPRDSMITRFLRCTFSLSFKFVRAYQSEFRGVFCTPGALSVYRAGVVHKVADEWVNQTFLGRICTTGEDRAMTNLILREGWLTAYQGNAIVRSKMPSNYVGMARMFLRWARSNIRETIILNRFMFKPFRREFVTSFRVNMLLVLSTLIVPYLLIGNSWALIFTNLDYAMRHAGMVVIYGLTMAAIYYRNERDSDWIWILAYEFFWIVSLSWVMPYAALSLRNTGWLTRGNAAKPK